MRPFDHTALPPLGGLSARRFLRDHWQRAPLLVRGAFREQFAPLTTAEIVRLATYEEAESRLVTRKGGVWSLAHGPFRRSDLVRPVGEKWSLLIQDTQHFSHEAHALLAHFDFLPQMRIDDLMVSLANRGGGVGPHVDSYDVFLLQGAGRRTWQIAAQDDLALIPGLPLKILKHFRPQQEWTLEPGDMLYLPPGFAHNGVALTDECITWSIGFRAPSHQELLEAYLDHLRDRLVIEGRYDDAARLPVQRTGALDEPMVRTLSAALRHGLAPAARAETLRDFLARYFTEPKAYVAFDVPGRLPFAAFQRRARTHGVRLALCTRLLVDRDTRHAALYINGECHAVARSELPLWQTLADTRRIDGAALAACAADEAAWRMLHAVFSAGYVEFPPAPSRSGKMTKN